MKNKLFDTDDYVLEYSLKSNQKELKIRSILLKHNIEKIVLPESIDKIPITGIKLRRLNKKNPLYTCGLLVLPPMLRSLDERAFECINSFNEVYIPKSVTAIPLYCFSESSFEKIIFEDESVVTKIETYAFAYSNIKKFHWPSGCNYISSYCFVYSMLEEITGIEHITSIGYEAFTFSKLKKFDWPAKCQCIPYHCFYGSALSALSGIENVTEIGEGAFAETKN